MEFLKALFGTEALTYEQLAEKLKESKTIKLANLSDGGYVDKGKFDAKEKELATANGTIKHLQDTVKKFDGVDLDGLKQAASEWERKYNTDIAALRKHNAVDLAIMEAKGKNAKAIKALLDLDKVKVKEDGTLDGLDLEAVKKSDPYLFTVEETKPAGNGNGVGGGNGSGTEKSVQEQFEHAVFRN